MSTREKADHSVSEAILGRIKAAIEEVEYWIELYNQLNPKSPIERPPLPPSPDGWKEVISLMGSKKQGPTN